MNTTQLVAELVARFPLSATNGKSLTNRLNSAFTKEGSVSQLFNSTSASLNKFAEDISDEQEQAIVQAIALVFSIGNELAKQAKESAKQAKKEVWADSQDEAQTIAKVIKPAKPSAPSTKTQRATLNAMSKSEQSDLILQLLSMPRG